VERNRLFVEKERSPEKTVEVLSRITEGGSGFGERNRNKGSVFIAKPEQK
jgi:hypothetical protein